MTAKKSIATKTVAAKTTAKPAAQVQIPARVRAKVLGTRHGLVVGEVGAATAAYSTGFAQGFMAAFKD